MYEYMLYIYKTLPNPIHISSLSSAQSLDAITILSQNKFCIGEKLCTLTLKFESIFIHS